MKIILSVAYAVFQISQGLLIHPYQTMQSLVEDRVFIWMSLLPSFILAIIVLSWRLILVPFIGIFFSCVGHNWFLCQHLYFLSNWITFFCIYWQILLLYLMFRFSQVFK